MNNASDSSTIKVYLSAYNAVSFLLWAGFLVAFAVNGFTLNKETVWLLSFAQGAAILEVLHAAMKWVKSPLFSTIAQVLSRLLVLVLIDYLYCDNKLSAMAETGVVIATMAWTITELVRYSYYFLLLRNQEPRWLLWMRYSLFSVLYPTGVAGEWMVLVAPVLASGFAINTYNLFMVFTLAAYVYYFPVLYGYMWKQRKSKLK